MNTEKLANTLRRKSPQRLEGSRFVIRQLCKVTASGSRERLVFVQSYRSVAYPSRLELRRLVKASRWDVPGSRLLPSDRTNALQSGSPPGVGRCDVMCLNRTRSREHTS